MKPSALGIYFVAACIRGGRHLLVHEGCARTALESLAWLRRRGCMDLFGFVMLPSRLHFLCRPKGTAMTELLSRFETFTTARMTEMLRRGGRHFLMQSFHAEQRGDSIWESLRAEAVATEGGAWAKLDYMHRLPLGREWQLAGTADEFPFSSACLYGNGRPPVIVVDDLRKLLPESLAPAPGCEQQK
jgi:putative transposase